VKILLLETRRSGRTLINDRALLNSVLYILSDCRWVCLKLWSILIWGMENGDHTAKES